MGILSAGPCWVYLVKEKGLRNAAFFARQAFWLGNLPRGQDTQLPSEGVEPTQAHAKQGVERGSHPLLGPRSGLLSFDVSQPAHWDVSYAEGGRRGALHSLWERTSAGLGRRSTALELAL